MSNEDTRIAIADALTAVTGITGYPQRPRAPKTGDGWPLWRGSERSAGQGYIETWAVIIVTPSDETAASRWADEKQADLIDALSEVLYLDAFAPASVPTDGNDLFALMITGRID